MQVSPESAIRRFAQTFDATAPLAVLDVGSWAIDGGARTVFGHAPWTYVGLDTGAGPNVDCVVLSPYAWDLASGTMDVVLTTACLGRVVSPSPVRWMHEVARVLRPGGWLYYSTDRCRHHVMRPCWRASPDGLPALLAWTGFGAATRVTEQIGFARRNLVEAP